MTEYIDREALLERIKPPQADDNTSAVLIGDARKILRDFAMSLPAADVVEVVRCRDCKNRAKGQDREYTVYCERFKQMMDKTDFCSYGERENDG